MIDYTPESLCSAVIELLSDRAKYDAAQASAIEFGREFDWPLIFEKALASIGIEP